MSKTQGTELIKFDEKRWWHPVTRTITSSRAGAWTFSHLAHHVDSQVIKWSSGQHSLSNWVADVPIVTVTTIGAKSGQPRTMPLVAIPDDDNVILIASNWGGAKNPAWYYNMCANPEVTLTYKEKSATYVARELSGEDRARAWEKAVAIYAGYTSYEARTGDRRIPVLVLTPRTQM